MTDECVICLKHLGDGPLTGQLIARVGAFEIWSARTDDTGRARLGYLFVESSAHIPSVADLSEDNAAALGILRTHLARALREITGAEHVITAVIGLGVPHFHEHFLPRMPGTSPDVAWHDTDSALPWADAKQVAVFGAEVRDKLGVEAP